jgi:hypothetical protein
VHPAMERAPPSCFSSQGRRRPLQSKTETVFGLAAVACCWAAAHCLVPFFSASFIYLFVVSAF